MSKKTETDRKQLAREAWARLTKKQREHLTFDKDGFWKGPDGRRGDAIHAVLRDLGIIKDNRVTPLGLCVVWHNAAQKVHVLEVEPDPRAPRTLSDAIIRLEALDECLWRVRDTLRKLADTMPLHDGSLLRKIVEDDIDDNLRRFGITHLAPRQETP